MGDAISEISCELNGPVEQMKAIRTKWVCGDGERPRDDDMFHPSTTQKQKAFYHKQRMWVKGFPNDYNERFPFTVNGICVCVYM